MDIGNTPMSKGYWGNVTSTVDWCEANYAKTPFIAEFYNTISSLTMVLQGLAGLYYHKRFGTSISFAFFCVFVVGLGSIAFHGTLKHEYQLLDELPMIYANLTLSYCLLEDQRERRHPYLFPIFAFGLVAFGLVFSVALFHLAYTSPFWASELFRWTFLIHQVLIILKIGHSYIQAQSPTVKRLFAVGITSYAFGFSLWFLDLNFCSSLQSLPVNPQLHALWHILAGSGTYLLLLVVAYYRAERIFRIHPPLRFGYGFIPYIGATGPPLVPRAADAVPVAERPAAAAPRRRRVGE